MLYPLLQGVLLGLTIAVSLGPALFALLDTSIKHGYRSGIYVALGIFVSDVALVMNTYLGASQIIDNPRSHLILGLIGGALMIAFGVFNLAKKTVSPADVHGKESVRIRRPGAVAFFLKGFFMNVANPFVWVFWITSVVAITSTYGADRRAIFLFFTGALGTIIATDVLKSLLAHRINIYQKPAVALWIKRIVGIILIAFGAGIAISVILDFYHIHLT